MCCAGNRWWRPMDRWSRTLCLFEPMAPAGAGRHAAVVLPFDHCPLERVGSGGKVRGLHDRRLILSFFTWLRSHADGCCCSCDGRRPPIVSCQRQEEEW